MEKELSFTQQRIKQIEKEANERFEKMLQEKGLTIKEYIDIWKDEDINEIFNNPKVKAALKNVLE